MRFRHLGSRSGFTLIELLVTTVILAILAMIVAKPIGQARENAMTVAAKAHVRHVINVVEQHQAITGRMPSRLQELEPYGYAGDTRDIMVCWFELSDRPGTTDDYVTIEARHRRGDKVVQTRHPLYSGRLDVIERAASTGPCR